MNLLNDISVSSLIRRHAFFVVTFLFIFYVVKVVYVMFKTRAARFLNGFKNIPGKACVKRVHNNDAFVNVGN